uniref:2-(3-amino-3-carboxypropyl)histidine synthase n=1 Tax=Spongospora subterranea TaxID=70186 RepID=A0A0H5QGF6_9EUKA|eukprot:CRZ01126.1 hypothetical protein [Spongospora subterranea]
MTAQSSVSPSDDDSVTQHGSPLYKDIAEDETLFRHYFDVESTVEFVRNYSLKRLALQVPDYLTWASARLAALLKVETGSEAFILADSTFSDCCVDEIAAEHINSDGIVHYGYRACLSQTSRLPVHHVFGSLPIDVDAFIDAWSSLLHLTGDVVVFADLHFMPSLVSINDRLPSNVQLATIGNRCAGYDFSGTPSALVHIGNDDNIRTVMSLHFSHARMFVYEPNSRSANTPGIVEVNPERSRALMRRRRYLIEKVKDSSVIGIVVGTLAVSGYLDCIAHLRHVIRQSGRKSYTLAVGRPNVPKLANFTSIDIFVMVSCPLSSIIDSFEYTADIVTPVEIEMALSRAYPSERPYTTDFHAILDTTNHVLNRHDRAGTTSECDDEAEVPRFSLITGKLVSNSAGSSLLPNELNTVAVVSEQRTFTGLDPQIGCTPIVPAAPGQSGIPSAYRQI